MHSISICIHSHPAVHVVHFVEHLVHGGEAKDHGAEAEEDLNRF